MAEVNAAFEAVAAEAVDGPAPAPPAPTPPAPTPPATTNADAIFSVNVLPVEACEMLIVVCRILGEVLAVEEPYAIEAFLEVPEPCFASLSLMPEAGGTQVTVEAEPADPFDWRGVVSVRDAIADELVALTSPARPATP